MVVGELKILIQMRHCKCCYFTQCLLQQLLPHQLPFLLPAGSCLAQRSGYICPPKRYITLLCLFGNIVDIIILGYNYHLFSSARLFFLISRDTKILTLLFPILLFILYILDIRQDLSVVGRDHGGGGTGLSYSP